jgi:hypothetical protein
MAVRVGVHEVEGGAGVTRRRPCNVPVRALLALAALWAACSASRPWDVQHAPRIAPDEQFRAGGTGGYDVFIWRCLDGQRVVIHQFCGDMLGCDGPRIERVACGATTAFEQRHDLADRGAPPLRPWPRTTN